MSTRLTLSALLVCLSLGGVRTAAAQATAAPAPPPAAATQGAAASAGLVVLRLSNNSLLVGTIVREEGDSVVFDAGALGQLTIKRSDIVAQLEPSAVAAAFQVTQTGGAPPPASGLAGFAAPGKVLWSRTVAFGGSYTSAAFKQGVIDPTIPTLTGKVLRLPGSQYVAQGQVTILRAASLGIFFVDASLNYADYAPFGKQTDIPKFSTGYNFRLKSGQKLYGVTRYTWYKDKVRQIDYSNQALFGLGIHTVDTKQVKLDVVPGIAAIREKKGTRFDDQWQGGWGILEQLTINPNQFAQIEQREMYYQLFNDSSYRGLESYVGFKGMLSKQLGVQFGLSHIYDNAIAQRPTNIPANALFPGQPAFGLLANEKSQVFLTAGVLVRF